MHDAMLALLHSDDRSLTPGSTPDSCYCFWLFSLSSDSKYRSSGREHLTVVFERNSFISKQHVFFVPLRLMEDGTGGFQKDSLHAILAEASLCGPWHLIAFWKQLLNLLRVVPISRWRFKEACVTKVAYDGMPHFMLGRIHPVRNCVFAEINKLPAIPPCFLEM